VDETDTMAVARKPVVEQESVVAVETLV